VSYFNKLIDVECSLQKKYNNTADSGAYLMVAVGKEEVKLGEPLPVSKHPGVD
jgi:hypothetical protein